MHPRLPGLHGKVAIVTGVGGGIGEAYARGLAAAGARVVVAEIDRAAGARVAGEIASGGGEAIAVVADVGAPDSTRAMAEEAAQRFGGIDCLVNNAAIFGGMKPAPFVVNGALLCACACVPPPPMRCPEIAGIPSRQSGGIEPDRGGADIDFRVQRHIRRRSSSRRGCRCCRWSKSASAT